MRFIIGIICFSSSMAMASVENMKSLIQEASVQEKRLHRKLLQSIQGTQIAVAYNDQWEQLQKRELLQNINMPIHLVPVQQEEAAIQ